jgi:transaldolase
MRLYVDTIILDEIKKAMESGFVYGITCNPFLFKNKLNKPFKKLIEDLVPHIKNEFHVQVPGHNRDELIKNAYEIYEIDPKKIIIKIPISSENVTVVKILKENDIKVTGTAVTSIAQAIVLALLNVDYIAPFVSRLDEAGYNGMSILKNIIEIYRINNVKTKIIAASIRTLKQVISAYKLGADAVTVKYDLFIRLIDSGFSHDIINQMNNVWSKIYDE